MKVNAQHRNWEKHIPNVLFSLRNRKNAATGYSPAIVLLGRTLSRPGELKEKEDAPIIPRNIVQEKVRVNQLAYKKQTMKIPD